MILSFRIVRRFTVALAISSTALARQNTDATSTWARAAQFRFVVHATDVISAGVSIENPEQSNTATRRAASCGRGRSRQREDAGSVTQTFFRDPKIGGMQFMLQHSNVRRTPFSVAVGTPADAKTNMLYLNVRYILP